MRFYIRPSLIFLVIFSVLNLVEGTKIGVQIPPRPDHLNKVNHIDLINKNIEKIDNLKDNESLKTLQESLNSEINQYILQNTCLRYRLSDFVAFNEISSKKSEDLLIGFKINFEHFGNDRIQDINLNILNKFGNTLRRTNRIQEHDLKFLVDYSLFNSDEKSFMNEYIDVCFENVKIDKSWSSKADEISCYLEIFFGINQISQSYQKSTALLDSGYDTLDEIDRELEIILTQLIQHLNGSEKELRNKNEDTLNKFQIFVIVTFVIYLLANFSQIWWLLNYLKQKNLI